jgi:NAD(P)-dependent dehydrogenase (short-subunit alcohol dehydrogenase family)
MDLDFLGKQVVVTGATGELGVAVVRTLVAAGAICELPVRSPSAAEPLVREFGAAVRLHEVRDLADEGIVTAFYAGIPAPWASVHTAGGFAMTSFTETSLDAFEKMHAINATSAFLCTREAARRMSDGGRIVNVAAAPALDPRRGAGMVAYTASKAALAALTVAAAEELAPRGIWVNAVVPSIMDTKANRAAMPNADFSRWPKLEEVAATIAFLASPRNRVTRGALVPVFGRS